MKDKIKLNKIEKITIAEYIVLAILIAVLGILEKNFVWIVVATLCIEIATLKYCDNKLLKAKQVIINLKEEEIEHKNDLIKTLLIRESRKRL